MKKFTFELEDNRWYVVLPEWEGAKEELEMVCGADTMLDIIAQGRSVVDVYISDEFFEPCRFTLELIEEQDGGGLYLLTSQFHSFEVWLCHVTKFVYGELPKTLWIS